MVRKPPKTSPKVKFVGLSAAFATLLLGVSSLSAEGVSSIAQGFQTTDANVVSGALVSLKDGTPNTVELATPGNLQQLVGVAGNKSLIELSNGSSSVQVVTNGNTPTLVSDMNGKVRAGDHITASPIAGVGMRATISGVVVGTAQDSVGSATQAREVTDKKGKKTTVHIGTVPVQVDKVFYQANPQSDSFLPSVLTDIASSIAGHTVSPVRIMAAVLLIALLFVVVTILLYSAVRSSIISIGRNPLSEQAVHKSLLEVGLTIIGVLVFTVIVVYLILMT